MTLTSVRLVLVIAIGLAILAGPPARAQPVTADEFRVTLLGTGSPAPVIRRFGPAVLV